ncbi:MAG: type I DNA topoisomerase [Candidatus Babeliales bacterium]
MGKRKKSMNEAGPKLLIVESPAKIKTISKFLGKDFKIMSTFGHVKDLPPRRIGVDIDEKKKTVELEYVVIKGKEDVVSDICKQARVSSEVYLASDPDREGEIISWHVAQEIDKVFADPGKVHRIVFNEITKPAITEAIEHKSHVNEHMVQAQQARRILDRWVGYQVSPILWKKIAKGLSAGRVQSVALLLICDRDAEVVAFKPEEYWSIHGLFAINPTSELIAELWKVNNKVVKIGSEAEAKALVAEMQKAAFAITKITEKKRLKNPPAPFMTSTLQQDSYNKLGLSVDRTMSIAQKLYEGVPLGDKDKPEALITYMRTDSLRISDTALTAVRGFIKHEYGDKYLPKTANSFAKKGAQDAHEAIRPIDVSIMPSAVARYLSPEQAKLYELIWKRFVASQMEAAEYFQRQVIIEGGKLQCKATGSSLMFDGFLKVYLVEEDEEDEKNVKIPKDIKESDPLALKKIDPKQHFTQPPARYTEATLVKELEKRGVGRPSTYATILSTIQQRGYVNKELKRFIPTELGKAVNDMLVKNLPDIINVTFTATMEENLDKIAQGETVRDKVLLEFYDKFRKDLVAFGGTEVSRKAVVTELDCPECKKAKLVTRFSKTGEFLGCSTFPECKFTSNFVRDEEGNITIDNKVPTQTDSTGAQSTLTCPKCSKNLVSKMGRFGPFLTCPGYPECKYIHQETLKMPCPLCQSKLARKRWRGGSFWGCSGYPKCTFSIFGEVAETPCPKCKAPYMVITKNKETGAVKTCSNKECGHKEPVES